MAFVDSSNTRILVGPRQISSVSAGVNVGVSKAMYDRTAFPDKSRVFIPGQRSGEMTVRAMFEDAGGATSNWAALTANHSGNTNLAVTVDTSNAWAVSGFQHNIWMASAYQANYAVNSKTDGPADLDLAFETNGAVLFGQTLEPLSNKSTTTTGAAQDGGAASTNGGFAHLHVTGLSGTTPTLDVIVEDSADGSTGWATIATFTQVTTSAAGLRVAVAAGSTVKRYLRAVGTLAGTTPVYTYAVFFARA